MIETDSMVQHFVRSLAKAFIGFLIGMAFYFSILIVYWQFAPYQTADVSTPLMVLNENHEVTSNGELRLEFKFTKYTDVNPTVSRSILCVDDTAHFVFAPSTSSTTRPIGTFTAKPVYIVDSTVPYGIDCYFQFSNEYQVNPIRKITKVWLSEPFTVKE